MKLAVSRIKPTSGFSHAFHLLFTVILPVIMFVLVRIGFIHVAALVILLSKWRMFAVRPRYWAINIRANAVDITVGLSVLVFMSNSGSAMLQLLWALVYGIWLTVIKPGSSTLKVSIQAMTALLFGLLALYLEWGGASLLVLVLLSWVISYISARHFLTSFDEPYAALMAHSWGYFTAAITWLLGHWLLFHGVISQPAVFLIVIGYGLGALYFLDHTDRLSKLLRRQFIFIMIAIVIVELVYLAVTSDKHI
jgi:hypothetical protein